MWLLTEFMFNFVDISYSVLQTQYLNWDTNIRRTEFIVVIQENKTYFGSCRLHLSHGVVLPNKLRKYLWG